MADMAPCLPGFCSGTHTVRVVLGGVGTSAEVAVT